VNLMKCAPALNPQIKEDANVFPDRPFLREEANIGENEAQKLSRRIQLALPFPHLLRVQADHRNMLAKR